MPLLSLALLRLLACCFSLIYCVAAHSDTSVSRPPNIVLLVVDDMGFSDIGAFGSEIETPSIDSLASGGVRFSNFHATGSCAPTRATLLTGVDHHLAGVGNMVDTTPLSQKWNPRYQGVLNERVVTIAQLLQDAGYRTSVTGKWHLGDASENLPPARGFDRSVIQADSGSDNFEMRPYLPTKTRAYWYEDGREMTSLPDDFYSSRFFVDKTIDYLREGQGSGKPFFAYVAFQANHSPVQVPRQFRDHYQGRYDQGWDVLRNERRQKVNALGLLPGEAKAGGEVLPAWNILTVQQRAYEARKMEVYAGMASAMDHEIGRLIDYLRLTGQYDNTLFVFLSDNGGSATDPYASAIVRKWLDWQYDQSYERMGDKGTWTAIGPNWASVANAPLAGHKFMASEGGLRVPLIIGGAIKGLRPHTTRALAHIADIAPTILEAAGIELSNGTYAGREVEVMRGSSLLTLLRDESASVHAADETIGYELAGNSAVFKGDYKLLRNLPSAGDNQWHLYDLSRDPGETKDLRDELPELYTQLKEEYRKYSAEVGVLPMPDGYDYKRQVQINSMVFFYLPRLALLLLGFLTLVLLFRWLWARQRKRRFQAQ
ncbi:MULTISPECIES: arylsulfatase [unclassified Pseudomonas]|uniref:arylsulfatase n=1 Tax=unclassified Pseudomonas TaxID=196821 RepID=UPI000876204C|nr:MULTISPECIES: arylsulfatase [unclassified Pseudomonas]SCZ39947.1 arylsulfatase [Pseudomonas sp. NFACC44-2]SDA89812.1 arylsulfatase [Pseudomonas sp. NFACC51]SDW42733.1 arylsulfatase [Pseudomonas sp. NFACC08-1]SFI16460.1 arylsulfatase [Pseudomonas sp. NFACC54]SFT28404.1 arylsulfatase [Pseudomonas sp. NFACC48-1]